MNDRLGRALLEKRVTMVLPHVQGRLLDVGCGGNELVKRYGNGVGVDVYPWPGADMVVPDTSKLPFPPESFDTISILAALNHIPNRKEVLRHCFTLLKPGGRFLATMLTPFLSRVWHTVRSPWDADQTERGMQEGEVYGFSPREMISLVEEQGFHFTEARRFMLGLNRLYFFEKRRG